MLVIINDAAFKVDFEAEEFSSDVRVILTGLDTGNMYLVDFFSVKEFDENAPLPLVAKMIDVIEKQDILDTDDYLYLEVGEELAKCITVPPNTIEEDED